MSRTSVFLAGVTGYIGASILSRLLAYTSRDTMDITVFVQDSMKAQTLQETFGVRAEVGALDDFSMLKDLASNADIIFVPEEYGLAAVYGILAGMKIRSGVTGQRPSLIYSVELVSFLTDAQGMLSNLSDEDSMWTTIATHTVYKVLLAADAEGYMSTYTIVSPLIFGLASNVLVDHGLADDHSRFALSYFKIAIRRGLAPIVGREHKIYSNVHINEVTDLCLLLFTSILEGKGSGISHGREGLYFAAGGEHSCYDIAVEVGKLLFKRGYIATPEPSAHSEAEENVLDQWIISQLTRNERVFGQRGRALGWHPVLGKQELLALLESELNVLVQKGHVPPPPLRRSR